MATSLQILAIFFAKQTILLIKAKPNKCIIIKQTPIIQWIDGDESVAHDVHDESGHIGSVFKNLSNGIKNHKIDTSEIHKSDTDEMNIKTTRYLVQDADDENDEESEISMSLEEDDKNKNDENDSKYQEIWKQESETGLFELKQIIK